MYNAYTLIEKKLSYLKSNLTNPSDRIFSGYNNLDAALNGFKKGYLYVIAGAASMGKTAFLVNLMHHMHAKYPDLKSIIFSIDLASAFFINRMMACNSEIDLEKINRNNLSYVEADCIKRKSYYLKEALFAIDDAGDATVHEIINKCETIFINQELDVIFIDYLELLKNNSNEELSAVLKLLQNFATTKNVCVVCTSLIPRYNVNTSLGKFMPKLSELNLSISRIADTVLIISKPDYYFNNVFVKDILELNIAKNRIGNRAKMKFRTSFRIQKITEYSESGEHEFIRLPN